MAASATANVKGGLFGDSVGLLQLVSQDGKSSERNRLPKELGRLGMLQLRVKMKALMGVAPGASASINRTVVENNVELGGKRNITTVSLINRVTTAADVTEINRDILTGWTALSTFGKTPPINKDLSPLGEQR